MSQLGFLDKVKTQAASATAMAKDAAQKGQARIDAMQAKRVADELLRDLGAVVYAGETGRSTATAEADAERLVASLRAHEAEHGPIDLGLEAGNGASGGVSAPAAAPPPGTPTSSPPPPPPPSGQQL